ncbi:STAS/SEC14 domain-containing protein [Aurantiacibacter hainanensis]|uniref:STAS/SEC14 domain-containing protein n=1 Tax=Aurantiacibacter hainanensis TaxID=3076114 RepID=UPI0030C756D2
MIDIETTHPGIVVLRPEGGLSEQDFADLAEAIDTHINETDTVPNLVIRVDKLPHWESLSAVSRHFHFVKTHGKIVRKVAVVGDSPLLKLGPEVAGHFVKASVRHFPANKFEDAKAWALAEGDDPGRFEVMEGLPRDVIAVRAVGIITAEDYRETLLPLVEEKLKEHDTLKLLFVMGDDYATFAGDAVWEDTKFDLKHLRDFSRIAVVTDVDWVTRTMKIFAPVLPYTLQVFPMAELEKGKSWIKR